MDRNLTKLSLGVVALAAVLGFAGTASAGDTPGHDECFEGDGAGDIDNLSASYIATNDQIVVVLLLCDTKDNKIKYRVHIDHTAPFFDDPPAPPCATTSDDTMKRFKGNKNTGPGDIVESMTTVANDTLTYTVDVDDLDPALMLGDTVFIWADTQHKGIIDRAPNTDGTDGCAKPEVETEVLALTLEEQVSRVFLSSVSNYTVEQVGPGATGADAKCQSLADAASLGGTWMAWMSDSTTSPNSRFTPNPNGYKLLNGTLIATDYDDLTDSTLLAAIDLTETGVGPTRPVVWTGTLANGDYAGASCADWTDSSAGLVKAGNPTSVDLKWTSAGRFSCTTKLPIYCFEQ